MKLTISLAQMYPKLADVEHNLAVHLNLIEQAIDAGADLVVFPELSLTGYQVQDLVPEVAIRAEADDPVFAQLLEASKRIDIVVGFVHQDQRQRFLIANAIFPVANGCTFITRSTCVPTACSTKAGISIRESRCAHSIPALAASAC